MREKEGLHAALLGDGYVVAISRRGSFRRLHYGGGCWRIPGVHYHEYEWGGQVAPLNVQARCRTCFPAGSAAARALEAEEVETSDSSGTPSSSSSSSTAGD